MTPGDAKTCTRCGETKPRSEFHRYKNSRDGRRARCRTCLAEYGREHYAANRERLLEQSRLWYQQNRDRKAATARLWYVANTERNYANTRRWVEANREAYTEFMRKRRARIAETTVGVVDLDALWTGLCALCSEPIDRDLTWPKPMSKSLDHIAPLSRGGTHTQDNLQWTHLVCNKRKGARVPD